MSTLRDFLAVEDMEPFQVPNFPMYLRINPALGCLEAMSRGEWKKLTNVDAIYSIMMNPGDIIRRPRLTQSEIIICKNMEATHVSRDYPPNDAFVSLWDAQPVLNDNNKYQCKDHYVGSAQASRFPTLRPGEWASVEEAESWNNKL